MRSPTRILAASTLTFEAFVVLFAGLVAKDLSSLSTATALWIFGLLAVGCLVTAGLLRSPVGYVVGSALQVAVLATAIWVPVMVLLGLVFGLLWTLAIVLGRRAERDARARWAAEAAAGQAADQAAGSGSGPSHSGA